MAYNLDNDMITIKKQIKGINTKTGHMEKKLNDVQQFMHQLNKKNYQKNYYRKNNKQNDIFTPKKQINELKDHRAINTRIKKLAATKSKLIGDDLKCNEKFINFCFEDDKFKSIIINNDKVQKYWDAMRKQRDLNQKQSLLKKYNELYILCKYTISQNQNDQIRLQRENNQKYIYDETNDVFKLNQRSKKEGAASTMI